MSTFKMLGKNKNSLCTTNIKFLKKNYIRKKIKNILEYFFQPYDIIHKIFNFAFRNALTLKVEKTIQKTPLLY